MVHLRGGLGEYTPRYELPAPRRQGAPCGARGDSRSGVVETPSALGETATPRFDSAEDTRTLLVTAQVAPDALIDTPADPEEWIECASADTGAVLPDEQTAAGADPVAGAGWWWTSEAAAEHQAGGSGVSGWINSVHDSGAL
ncbi:MAG: hypothetical protein P8R54_30805 [Myxococcota bacterium]|nr:hypothetical protein [Myxococcota bacterium]